MEAIILAHIAPLPPHPLGASQQRPIVPGEGEAHFESVLHVVQELYNRHKSQYPSQTTSWAIFGRFEGTTAMPKKLAIAKRRFQAMGLPMKFAQYDIAKASERINPAAGTVVGVLQNRKTYLYVEDQVRDSINFNDQPRPTGVTSSATTTSSGPGQSIHANKSTSTNQTPVGSPAPAPGFWAYARQQNQFFYRTAAGQPVPGSEWPRRAGRQRVLVVETKTLMGFDFDANQLFTLETG